MGEWGGGIRLCVTHLFNRRAAYLNMNCFWYTYIICIVCKRQRIRVNSVSRSLIHILHVQYCRLAWWSMGHLICFFHCTLSRNEADFIENTDSMNPRGEISQYPEKMMSCLLELLVVFPFRRLATLYCQEFTRFLGHSSSSGRSSTASTS